MITINPKKLKPYGDRLDDGVVQLSFTLPVSASPEAKEAAKVYVEKLGFKEVAVAAMEAMGSSFCHFVVYAVAKPTIDFTKIRVPKVEHPTMDFKSLCDYMERHLDRPLVVVGAATGSDAHTVGIDAIMNMKGYDGDYGLERYPLFKAVNLRSQLTNEQLLDKAVELSADAILISQIVTQRGSHLENLKAFQKSAKADRRLPKETITIIGGPRLDHAMALKLGFDAGYGTGTTPSAVATFIVQTFMQRHGIKERAPEEAPSGKKPATEKQSSAGRRSRRRSSSKPASAPSASKTPESKMPESKKPEQQAEGAPQKKRSSRRRGRRGGRGRRKKSTKSNAK